MIQRASSAFFHSSGVLTILQCAMAALSVDHPEAIKSVTKFIIEVVDGITRAKKVCNQLCMCIPQYY